MIWREMDPPGLYDIIAYYRDMRTCVIYASKYGTTRECAERIADELGADSFDVRHARDIDLNAYDLVVLGSACYGGMVMPRMRRFVAAHLDELLSHQAALFLTGVFTGVKRDLEMNVAYPPSLRAHAIAYEFFGGRIDIDQISRLDRLALRGWGVTGDINSLDSRTIKLFLEKIKNSRQKPNY